MAFDTAILLTLNISFFSYVSFLDFGQVNFYREEMIDKFKDFCNCKAVELILLFVELLKIRKSNAVIGYIHMIHFLRV